MTIAALMKPKPATRELVRHRNGMQPWSGAIMATLQSAMSIAAGRIGIEWETHFPAAGEYLMISELPREFEEQGKAMAIAASNALPQHWFVLGRLFAHQGKFYRRRRRYGLGLRVANDVHLTRALRKRLQGLV